MSYKIEFNINNINKVLVLIDLKVMENLQIIEKYEFDKEMDFVVNMSKSELQELRQLKEDITSQMRND